MIKRGVKFKKLSDKKNHPNRVWTVVDIWTTTNINGDHVKTRYVAETDFLGQKLKDTDVVEVTILRGLIE